MRVKLKLTMFLLCFYILSFGQNKQISGVVEDEDGLLLPGVSIAIKGTTRGTVTDINGEYSLQAAMLKNLKKFRLLPLVRKRRRALFHLLRR